MKNIDIYYADDDIDDLEIFTDAIDKITKELHATITLHTFQDGPALLNSIRAAHHSDCLILLDINMPVKNGLDILIDIRKDPELKNLPVVMYSTSAEPQIINSCRESGADLYAVKPNDFNRLVAMVNRILTMAYTAWPADQRQFVLNSRYL